MTRHLRRVLLLLLVSTLLATAAEARAASPDPDLVGPVERADPGPTATTPRPGSTLRFTGRGHGHGRGMSQYGAKGAAERGRSYRRIISFYYPRTRWARTRGRIRVLVSADTSPDLVVRDRSGLRVRKAGTGSWRSLRAPGATHWRITAGAGRRSVVSYRRSGPRWRVVRRYRGPAEFSARGGHPVRLVTPAGTTTYRGTLRSAIPPRSSRNGPRDRDTVNVVSLETYLRGVVPLEMPALWARQAVRAQAVAARSYAAWERAHPRSTHYQVCDTTSCQVYGGADAEHRASDAAIRATRRVARFKRGRPAFTQFSASNGGWTARGAFAYLPARRDRSERGSGNPYARWTRSVSRSAIARWRPAVGTLRRLRLTNRDGHGRWGGRVGTVVLVGSRSTQRVSGDDFRFAFGLPSTWFTQG